MNRILYFFALLLFISPLSLAQNNTSYWQQHANYEMHIDVDTEKYQYKGKQKLVYTNNSPDVLDRVYYHLYFNAFQPGSMMDKRSRTIADPDGRVRDRIYHLKEDEIGYQRIRSLKQDGKDVTFSEEGTILVVELNKPIKPGGKTTFDMEWDAQVPLQVRRSGRTNAEGIEFSMSQWYPKLAEYDYMGWHPNPYVGREFHGVWGNFDVKITIDKDYVIGATGILQNPNEIGHGYENPGTKVQRTKGDKLTWHFVADDVIDFFWGADPDFIHTTAQVPNGPKLHFFYQHEVDVRADSDKNAEYQANWEQLPELTVKGFEYAQKYFGKYPYPQYSVVQGGDGGMEYPMGTLITGARSLGSLTGVTVHEFYHSWFQGVLATNEALYPWIDEGFTVFASAETMNHIFDRQADNPYEGSYRSYYGIVRSGLEEALTTHADHYNTNRAYGAASYSKGAVYLAQLSYVIGEEAFRKGMLRYYDEWKMKHPTANDFLRVMEKESGMILDWYNEYFVQTTKTIDYGVKALVGNDNKTIVELERHGLMPMPIDLEVEYTDGSKELFYIPLRIMRGEKPAENDLKRTTLDDWMWVYPTYQFEISRSASSIKTITIDPTGRLADVEKGNNSFDVAKMIKD